MKALLGVFSAVFYLCAAALAETIVLRPVADTTLFENFPDNNLGGVTSLAAGTTAHDFFSRALIKFDVASQVPANAIIHRARVRMAVVRAPLGPIASTFTLRRVLRDWVEGSKSFGNLGELAADGETTWNSRFHPSTTWSAPGGVADEDFSGIASSSSVVGDVGPIAFDTSAQLVADVQDWLANPAQNFGWMLISESEEIGSTARRFGSREDPPNAPTLEIEYSQPLRIENVTLNGATFRFSFPVEPRFTYTVEARTGLATGSWLPFTNFTETASSYNALISDGTPPPSRFYRVLKAPCNCP